MYLGDVSTKIGRPDLGRNREQLASAPVLTRNWRQQAVHHEPDTPRSAPVSDRRVPPLRCASTEHTIDCSIVHRLGA